MPGPYEQMSDDELLKAVQGISGGQPSLTQPGNAPAAGGYEQMSDDELLQQFESTSGGQKPQPENPTFWRALAESLPYGVIAPVVAAVRSNQETTEAPVSTLERATASFKSTPQDQANYYGSIYGQENVKLDPEGNISIREGTGEWKPVNPEGIGLGDVAGLAGDLPEMAGGVAGAIVGAPGGPVGAVGGAAAGGAAGNVLKQSIGAMIPGQETITTGERALEVGKSAALMAAGEGIARGIIKGIEMLSPASILNKILSRHSTELAKTAALEARTGINVPLGEATGNRGLQITEARLRANPLSAGVFRENDVNNLAAIQTRFDRLLTKLATEDSNAVSAGTKVRDTFESGLEAINNLRKTQAEKDFRFLRTTLGDVPVMRVNNLRKTLDDLIKQYGEPGSGMPSESFVREVHGIIQGLDRSGPKGMMPIRRFQTLLERYGEAGYSKTGVSIFKALDKGTDATIAQRLYVALQRDLEANAAVLGKSPHGRLRNAANMLMDARNNFARYSDQMDVFTESALGKVLKGWDPRRGMEGIAESTMNLPPSQLQAALGILNRADPAAANMVRRYSIQRALESAANKAGQDLPIDAKELIKRLPDDGRMAVLFEKDPVTRQNVADLVEALEKMRSSGGALMGQDPIMSAVKGMVNLMLPSHAIMTVSSNIFVPQQMARIMVNPTARQHLANIAKAKTSTKAVMRSVTWLNAFLANQGPTNYQEQ